MDKQQLLSALRAHLKATLAAQRQEAEDLLAQASDHNQAFFLKFRQRHGQDIARQLDALEACAPVLQPHYQSVEPGALVQVSTKHLPVRVPAASTPPETYQALRKKGLAKQFDPILPELACWWILPRVTAHVNQGILEFDHQGHCTQVVSGEVYGYERSTLLGLQTGDSIIGADYSGYYEDRQGATYPDIIIRQIRILDIS